MFDLTFTVDARDATTPLTLAVDRAVIAGWTGRDPVARDKHIAELEAVGIARPATTPIYYRVSARRLTMADSIEVSGGDSSGEVEFVLIGWQGRIFVGCGSDHTDRKVEAYSVTVSKQMCDKVVAPTLWELSRVLQCPVTYFFEGMERDAAPVAAPNSAAAGKAESEDIAGHADAIRLVRAYNNIARPETRRQILDLATALRADRKAGSP